MAIPGHNEKKKFIALIHLIQDKNVLYIIPEGLVRSVHSLGGALYFLPVETA